MLQRGNRRTRRVSAISDYLESFRKGKMPGVALCEKGREKGNGEREREEEESELWIAGGTGKQFVKLQEISFRASTWQIDFVQRLFSHI